jgi:Mrp family chromosome partitioning ATPase
MRLADWVPDNLPSPCGQGLVRLLQALVPARAAQARVIAFTSAVPDRRKAVTALALARIAARYGLRTVLIDADQGVIVPGAPNAGMAAVLQGMPLPKALLRDRLSGAFVLSSVPAAWTAPRTADLIQHLRQSCDLILIDAAPAGVQGPWPALARLVDGVVLFTAPDGAQSAFDRALRLLVAISAPLSGLVVAR